MTVALVLAGVLVVIAGLAGYAAVRSELAPAARIAGWVGEALLVAYVAVDLLQLRGGDRPDNLTVHLGYCLAAVGLIPVLTLRPTPPAAGEEAAETPEPASPAVLAVACLACAAIVVRMAQTR